MMQIFAVDSSHHLREPDTMMTAEQYRASLNDGRETFFGGEQIFDLPGHPILGQTVESAARGYARFYDPKPGAIGAFMKIPGRPRRNCASRSNCTSRSIC